MLKSRAERSALGPAPDVAVVDVWLKFESKNLTTEAREQNKRMTRAPPPHKKPVLISQNNDICSCDGTKLKIYRSRVGMVLQQNEAHTKVRGRATIAVLDYV